MKSRSERIELFVVVRWFVTQAREAFIIIIIIGARESRGTGCHKIDRLRRVRFPCATRGAYRRTARLSGR